MKIILIHPGISSGGFDSFKKNNYINHGLAYIGAMLAKNGIDYDYWDLRRFKDWEEFKEKISKSEVCIYGISCITTDFDSVKKITKIIKKKNLKNIVIVGGVHPTICSSQVLRVKQIDYVVKGEGELVFTKLVKKIVNNNRPKERLISGESIDLSEIPHIDRDKFFHSQGEINSPIVADLPRPFATIVTSRGCPFRCSFCQPAEKMVFGGKVRLRTVDDVISEIKEIDKKYGLKSFIIHDDLFTVDMKRLIEFARKYKKTGIKAVFFCQARADIICQNEKIFRKLRRVGLRGVLVGFESGSQRILDFIKKGTKVEDNVKASDICHRLGIKVWANYMLGIPTESYKEMWQTLEMIKRIRPDYHSPSLFTPFPATELYNYCKENNLLIIRKSSQINRGLEENKIKGMNYSLIRLMLFMSVPWRLKPYYGWIFFKSLVLDMRKPLIDDL